MTTAQAPPEHLLTPAEVAALVFVDPKTVSRWASAGKIPSIRTPGGHRRFRRSDVDALLPQGNGQDLDVDRAATEADVAAVITDVLESQAAAATEAVLETAAAVAAAVLTVATAAAKARRAGSSRDAELAAARVAQAATDSAARVARVVAATELSLERETFAAAEALHNLTMETARQLALRNHAVTRQTLSPRSVRT